MPQLIGRNAISGDSLCELATPRLRSPIVKLLARPLVVFTGRAVYLRSSDLPFCARKLRDNLRHTSCAPNQTNPRALRATDGLSVLILHTSVRPPSDHLLRSARGQLARIHGTVNQLVVVVSPSRVRSISRRVHGHPSMTSRSGPYDIIGVRRQQHVSSILPAHTQTPLARMW